MRRGWWVPAAFAGMLVLSLLGPLHTAAQDSSSGAAPGGQAATIMADTPMQAEPSADAAQIEWLAAASPVTILAAPITSMFDGQLWVLVGSSQATGYVPVSAITTAPADPVVEPEPVIIAWKLVQTGNEVPCRTEPRDDAGEIATLVPGQEIGLIAEPVDGWQPVRCADQNGFVRASVFDAPVGSDPALGAPPVSEQTPVPQPETLETPEIDETTTQTAASETPAPLATETSTPPPAASPSPVTPGTETVVPSGTPVSMDGETAASPEFGATESPVAEISAAPPVETIAAVAAELLPPDPVQAEGEVSAIIGGGSGYVRNTDGAGLRCRAGANLLAATITVLPEGAAVTSRGAASGDWQPVYCAGQSGFVWAEFVGNSPGASSPSGGTGSVRNTQGDWLRCRSTASYGAAVITTLAPGATATIRGSSQGGWVPILCGGQNGWVHSDFFGAGSSSSGSTSGGFSVGQTVHVSGTEGMGVRFRSSASYSGAVISALLEGSGVTVRSGSIGEWIAVTRNGSNGFIHVDYLAAGAGASSSGSVGSSDLTAGSHAKVTESLRIRSGATSSASTLTVATTGIVVKITGAKANGFYPVSWDGLIGYMHSDYLVWTSAALSSRTEPGPSSSTPVGNAGSGGGTATGQSIVNFALRYIGYPYVWAGRGPAQFDCAGFVYWVMYNVTGVNLVGGVINQYTYGRPIPWGELQPGDIVNFSNTYMPGLSHNGIYIGNNQFVHASNEIDGVIISNLTSNYYVTRWYGARRII